MAERIHLSQLEDRLKKQRNDSENNVEGAKTTDSASIQRAIENPTSETLTPDVINSLQRTHGNQFVSQLVGNMNSQPATPLSAPIQAKMTVTAANDQYEAEADNVARSVVQQINNPGVQRESDPEEEMMAKRIQREDALQEDEEVMMQRIQREDALQEDEEVMMQRIQREDALQEDEEVMMQRIQREDALQEDEEVMMQRIQREDALQEDEEVMMQRIQRASDLDFYEGGEVGGGIESQIEKSRGGGSTMDNGTLSKMNGAFGADFSGVRVHTDDNSDALNSSIQAKAFTTGQDIFFSKGAYDPGSTGGQELLAHELTHVVQQNGASVMKKEDD